jgi:hypothetical protein
MQVVSISQMTLHLTNFKLEESLEVLNNSSFQAEHKSMDSLLKIE